MTNKSQVSSAAEECIEEQAVTWFEKKQFWTWTDVDERTFNIWLTASPAHEIAYWRLEAGWQRAERMAALKRVSRPTSNSTAATSATKVASLAAAIFVFGVLASVVSLPLRHQEAAYSTPIGARRTVLLADGSKIELNTGSSLKVSYGDSRRQVTLERGEAYFSIKHDPSRPFVVLAAGRRVTDLGTKFLLRLDSDKRLMMTLTEGRARLDATTSDAVHRQATLEPGDIVISTAAMLQLRKGAPQEIRRELGWRADKLIFDHTTLVDAVAQFNRYNIQKLRVDDPEVATRTVSGTFRTTNTSDFASLARDVLGLQVQRKDGVILITR